MRSRMVWILFGVLALMIAAGGAAAQQSPYIPAIVQFDATVTSSGPFTRSAVEDGAVTVMLDWRIVNTSDNQVVRVDYLQGNTWVPAWPTLETVLPIGSREVAVQDPLNFGSPTFRLTLTQRNNVLEQRYIVIPFEPNTGSPEISFSTPVTSLTPQEILRTTAVVVSWDVTNRPEGSQLVFNQVLPDGSQINVELPRTALYVPSSGTGAVQPRLPEGASEIVFRLSVIDAISGAVYGVSDISIPIVSSGTPAPTAAATATPVTPDMQTPQILPTAPMPPDTPQVLPPAPTETTVSAIPGPEIELFTVAPSIVPPGSNVTMTWNVIGATAVQISEVLPNSAAGLTYVQLPSSGSVSVPLPSGATTTVTYILTARNATGGESTAEQTVTIEG